MLTAFRPYEFNQILLSVPDQQHSTPRSIRRREPGTTGMPTRCHGQANSFDWGHVGRVNSMM